MIINKIVVIVSMLISSYAMAATDVSISVNGMVCGFCAQGITKKFSKEPAVDAVKVSLENKLVNLKLKEGKDISDDSITEILKDAGYTVSKIDRK